MRHNFWPPPMSLLHVMYHTCSNHHSVNLFHPHPKIRLQALLLLKAIGPTLTPGVSKDCDGIESKYLGWGMRAEPAAPPASCLTLTAIIPQPLSPFSFVCTPTFHKLEIMLWGLKWQVYIQSPFNPFFLKPTRYKDNFKIWLILTLFTSFQGGLLPPTHWWSCDDWRRLYRECSTIRILRLHWQELCHSKLKGIVQEQHKWLCWKSSTQ